MYALIWLFPRLAAAIFAATALVFLANPEPLSRSLTNWGYGRNFNHVFAGFLILTAVLLATPQLRLWGVALAAFALFGTTVMLLERRKYLYALPGIVLLGALPFALATS